ncbi:MAG: tetratricopeptide repeat protein [Alphaproteobacteria bacterium]|nr:tetratricopeptide repeat protein [Alphaproteobacteria bacterium]
MTLTPELLARLDQANKLTDQGRTEEAEALLRQLQGFAPAHANLALLLEQKRDLLGALEQHRCAAALMPDNRLIQFNLATALEHARRYQESEAAYRLALALDPQFAEAWHNLGNCLQEQGRVEEADQAYRQALRLKPDFRAARSSHLMNLHYLKDATPQAIHDTTKAYAAALARQDKTSPAPPRADKTPLRIGLLCAYVRSHPLGSLAEAGLSALDHERFPLFFYVNEPGEDDCARSLRTHCKEWRQIGELSDQAVAQQIEADGIDILIDLAGHTRGHRLGVMALKPAPVQMHWGVAYWNGLGMEAIDFLLTDRVEVPPDSSFPLSEAPLYLPHSFACYHPPDDAPPVSSLPMLEHGAPCFGSFNRLAKLNDGVLELWGRLMAAAPEGSRLFVQAHAFDDESVRQRFLERLAAVGIASDQVELVGALKHADLLAAYAKVDVALDCFPWSGSIITLEALLMGVPVVTCPHPSITGRHSASFLSSLGETGWIARDADSYIATALDLVSDATRLAGIRSGLRDRLLASPVCNGALFARNLESLLTKAWIEKIRPR